MSQLNRRGLPAGGGRGLKDRQGVWASGFESCLTWGPRAHCPGRDLLSSKTEIITEQKSPLQAPIQLLSRTDGGRGSERGAALPKATEPLLPSFLGPGGGEEKQRELRDAGGEEARCVVTSLQRTPCG